MIRVYCAGKIAKNDWRHTLFPGLREVFTDECRSNREPFHEAGATPVRGQFEYAGPFFVSCDHGCRHREGGHGALIREPNGDWIGRGYVARKCLNQLCASDAVFVWLDSLTAFGTMTEIGYARAAGKPIWLYSPNDSGLLEDAWFPVEAAGNSFIATDPIAAFLDFEGRALLRFRVKLLRELPYSEYLQTDHWKALRADALQRAEYRCQVCNGTETLTVHHRTYDRLGEELAADLTVLCRPCHSRHHASFPTAARPPRVNG